MHRFATKIKRFRGILSCGSPRSVGVPRRLRGWAPRSTPLLRQTASRRPTRKDNYGRQGSINDQINKELYSPTCTSPSPTTHEEEGSGYANYFEIQAQEERDHAMIFRNYLHENGEAVKLLAIDMPDKTFANFLEPLEAAMEHEKYVTSLINDIYAAALEAHDYRAQKFLGWFIDEQLEEEDNADTMITNMKLFGGDPKGLYDLDQACAARVYTVPSPLAGK